MNRSFIWARFGRISVKLIPGILVPMFLNVLRMFSAAPVDLEGCRAEVELVQVDPGELTLTTVLRRLRSDFGVASLLCEGGPTVFGSLLQEHLVDELFLTLAPKLVGGGASPTISSGTELKELQPMEVVWALEHGSALYLRYRLG